MRLGLLPVDWSNVNPEPDRLPSGTPGGPCIGQCSGLHGATGYTRLASQNWEPLLVYVLIYSAFVAFAFSG